MILTFFAYGELLQYITLKSIGDLGVICFLTGFSYVVLYIFCHIDC